MLVVVLLTLLARKGVATQRSLRLSAARFAV